MSKYLFDIKISKDNIINGYIFYSQQSKPRPLIIILHGFKASKDWGFFPYIAERISERCGTALSFDFSHNGKPNSEYIFTEKEKFADNTISKELNDLDFVINSFRNFIILDKNIIEEIWDGRIFLLGHSLGAAIALLYWNLYGKIDKIAALAPIGYLDRYSSRQKKMWKEKGFLEFQVNSTKQVLRMNKDYLEDIEKNEKKYSLISAVKKIDIALQIIYGSEDLTITKKERDILIENANKDFCSIEWINQTGHTFGCETTFCKSNTALDSAIELTIDFFNK